MTPVTFRVAGPDDAQAVAALHADSWRKHYRGAYSDAFLDDDVFSDRNAVWSHRLGSPNRKAETQLAEMADKLVGFVHTVLDADQTWGALLDNLHVLSTHQREGIGAALMARSAAFAAKAAGSGLYLWVLEQNVRAQRFYEAQGGMRADAARVTAVDRAVIGLDGAPRCFRYVWQNPTALIT